MSCTVLMAIVWATQMVIVVGVIATYRAIGALLAQQHGGV